MDHDQDDIPEDALEHCPKHCLSGAEFKEAAEANPHEQQNVKSLSGTEFKGDIEEKKSVPQVVKQFDRTEFKEDVEEKHHVPQNVKQFERDESKGDIEEKQSVPQNVKQFDRAEFKGDIEEKQSVPQNVKQFDRAEFKGDIEEKQSVPQNVKQFDRAELKGDIEEKQRVLQIVKQFNRAFKEDIEKNQNVAQNVKQFNIAKFKGEEKQNVPHYVKLFGRAALEEDIEENLNEHQNFLKGNSKEKTTDETQSRTIQSCRCPKYCWYGVLITIIIILCILLLVIYAKNCGLNSCSPCPHYWIGYEGKCYFFSRDRQNWTSSQNFCSSHNSYLARIESEEDQAFMMLLKSKGIYWIGLQRHSGGQPWAWTNGEKSRLEVIEGGGNCAYLDNEGKAVSSGCHKILPWICSRSAAYP